MLRVQQLGGEGGGGRQALPHPMLLRGHPSQPSAQQGRGQPPMPLRGESSVLPERGHPPLLHRLRGSCSVARSSSPWRAPAAAAGHASAPITIHVMSRHYRCYVTHTYKTRGTPIITNMHLYVLEMCFYKRIARNSKACAIIIMMLLNVHHIMLLYTYPPSVLTNNIINANTNSHRFNFIRFSFQIINDYIFYLFDYIRFNTNDESIL